MSRVPYYLCSVGKLSLKNELPFARELPAGSLRFDGARWATDGRLSFRSRLVALWRGCRFEVEPLRTASCYATPWRRVGCWMVDDPLEVGGDLKLHEAVVRGMDAAAAECRRFARFATRARRVGSDPVEQLATDLGATGRASLAWCVRMADAGADPLEAAWRASAAPLAMLYVAAVRWPGRVRCVRRPGARFPSGLCDAAVDLDDGARVWLRAAVPRAGAAALRRRIPTVGPLDALHAAYDAWRAGARG